MPRCAAAFVVGLACLAVSEAFAPMGVPRTSASQRHRSTLRMVATEVDVGYAQEIPVR